MFTIGGSANGFEAGLVQMQTIKMSMPNDFQFAPTVLSHGWCELPPFYYNESNRTLERLECLNDGNVVNLLIRQEQADNTLKITILGLDKPLTHQQHGEVTSIICRCFNLDQDLKDFYNFLQGKERYRWISTIGAGRLLVAPTVWENLVKTLLTTNTTWNVTVQMCHRLVKLGTSDNSGKYCFPTAQQIARFTLDELTEQIRAGYRSAYLHQLATAIHEGTLDVETWVDEMMSENLYYKVKSLKGFGDYAAGSMLKLLGRFERIGIDTACREVFRVQLNNGIKASDPEIQAYYEPFGKWRGLVMWMDVMQVNLISKNF
ncbi:hypothetical protein [Nodosilinea sp. E11]|uniref:hypothetical protein n=1 Tax=Nodosilinea sp. E11 TaxID=3037479 RepID=UPI0029351A2E|nr:hypothetical protein [Nodosilinea sp. E11]WOD37331.1 hypothetical protein RRF56_02410 [Nodosilinea sp. E11]